MHRFAPYFPSGHRPENNIFFFAFSSLQSMSRCIETFHVLAGSESFTGTLCEATALPLRMFTAEMPGLQLCQLHLQAGSQTTQTSGTSPASHGGACCLPWLSPFLALEPVSPPWSGTCLPHLQFSFKQAAVLPTVSQRGHAGQEGLSAISAAPQHPLPCPPFPNFANRKGAEDTLVCYHHRFRHKCRTWHPTGCCEEN